MLFDGHKMGRAMGGRGIDMITDQDLSAGNEQFMELCIKLWDAACVTELVHGLKRNDQIEAGRNRVSPSLFFKIPLNENGFVFEVRQPASAEFQHLRREIKQRISR